MYHTGLDPMTKKPVETPHKLKDRRVQRALLQFFKPENWFLVHKALTDHGRKDLIGKGPLALIPENPPKEALEARRKEATYVHARTPAFPGPSVIDPDGRAAAGVLVRAAGSGGGPPRSARAGRGRSRRPADRAATVVRSRPGTR